MARFPTPMRDRYFRPPRMLVRKPGAFPDRFPQNSLHFWPSVRIHGNRTVCDVDGRELSAEFPVGRVPISRSISLQASAPDAPLRLMFHSNHAIRSRKSTTLANWWTLLRTFRVYRTVCVGAKTKDQIQNMDDRWHLIQHPSFQNTFFSIWIPWNPVGCHLKCVGFDQRHLGLYQQPSKPTECVSPHVACSGGALC